MMRTKSHNQHYHHHHHTLNLSDRVLFASSQDRPPPPPPPPQQQPKQSRRSRQSRQPKGYSSSNDRRPTIVVRPRSATTPTTATTPSSSSLPVDVSTATFVPYQTGGGRRKTTLDPVMPEEHLVRSRSRSRDRPRYEHQQQQRHNAEAPITAVSEPWSDGPVKFASVYPSWWGHQEHVPSGGVRPQSAASRTSASRPTVGRSGETDASGLSRQNRSDVRSISPKSETAHRFSLFPPPPFPKRMIDESTQTPEPYVRTPSPKPLRTRSYGPTQPLSPQPSISDTSEEDADVVHRLAAKTSRIPRLVRNSPPIAGFDGSRTSRNQHDGNASSSAAPFSVHTRYPSSIAFVIDDAADPTAQDERVRLSTTKQTSASPPTPTRGQNQHHHQLRHHHHQHQNLQTATGRPASWPLSETRSELRPPPSESRSRQETRSRSRQQPSRRSSSSGRRSTPTATTTSAHSRAGRREKRLVDIATEFLNSKVMMALDVSVLLDEERTDEEEEEQEQEEEKAAGDDPGCRSGGGGGGSGSDGFRTAESGRDALPPLGPKPSNEVQ
ncbi:hypothetical protein DFJ73DRAFT_958679 [Zopfochytrium polystomum]|nr:hypothetical protein DFJ73DRAFT_958679 [Zopfochytrium polystomum]